MSQPLITIITVVLNDRLGIERTLTSVVSQTFENRQHVIVDGQSTDGTVEFLKEQRCKFDVLLSEPDYGIYDAMNKGLRTADGDWVLFMNAGDVFASIDSLALAVGATSPDVDIVYSDVIFRRQHLDERIMCLYEPMRVHHQAVAYRKAMHHRFGEYLVAPGVTISDYLFFNLIAGQRWLKIQQPIAICDVTGVSSRPMSYYQKLAVDLIFRNRGPQVIGMMLLVYPFYRGLIRPFVRLFKRFSGQ